MAFGQDWSAPPTAAPAGQLEAGQFGGGQFQPNRARPNQVPTDQILPPQQPSANTLKPQSQVDQFSPGPPSSEPLAPPRLADNAFPPMQPYRDPAVDLAGAELELETDSDSSAAASLGAMKGVWAQITGNWQEQWGKSNWSSKLGNISSDIDLGRMLGSLALVLGGYFAFLWLMGRINPRRQQGVPRQVLEILGSVPFGPGKNLQIIRLGSKLLLLIHGNDGTQPIGEITDPEEVEYLASLCPGRQKASPQRAEQIRQAVQARAPIASPAPATRAAAPPARQQESHLSNILQSLNGPRGNQGAVFEA